MRGLGKRTKHRNGKKEDVMNQGITERIARASARRPWLVIGLWIALLVVGGMLAGGVGDVLTTEMRMANETESAKADRLIEERMGQGEPASEIVIVRSSTFTAQDEPFGSFVGGLVEEIDPRPTYDCRRRQLLRRSAREHGVR